MSEEYTIYQTEYLESINETYSTPLDTLIDDGKNFIHPTAIIGSGVVLGKNNYIGANCYIVGDVIIGDNNHFEAFCSVGTFPEHRAYFDKKKMTGVRIGDNNVFREFTTINSGISEMTKIGNNVWMLRGSHVGHDSTIHDFTTLSCNTLIGGHSSVGYMVNFGLGSICHQFSVIGSGSMIGMGSIITKTSKILPFSTYVGNPAKFLKANSYAISKVDESTHDEWVGFYDLQLMNMERTKLK